LSSTGDQTEDGKSPEAILPGPTPSEIEVDDSAYAEDLGFHTGVNIQSKKLANQLKKLERADTIFGHLHLILLIAIWVISITSLGLFVVMAIHYAIPEKWAFLSKDQISDIKGVLLNGGLGAVLGIVAKQYLNDRD
jgi:purine-cytosine permease-like protein